MRSVIQYAPAILAGSALAGFGLSFGRDVYRKAKKYWPLVAILLCVLGAFFSGLWLFRNYRTILGSIFKKLGASIVLIASCIVLHLSLMLLDAILPITLLLFDGLSQAVTSIVPDLHPVLAIPEILRIVVFQGIAFAIGAIVGVSHRRKRKAAWIAEDHNIAFLADHGLEVVDADDDGNLRLRSSSEEVGYRLTNDLSITRELEFLALGRRNKRAYMKYDEIGRYTAWSGLVEVR